MKNLFISLIILFAPIQQSTAEDINELFSLKVYPLLKDKCFGCHGDKKKVKGDFDIRSMKAILKGGESGKPGLVKGNAKKSLIYQSVLWLDEDLEMPPKENDRLSSEQIKLIKLWIDNGAPWPSEEKMAEYREAEAKKLVTSEGIIVRTSGGQDATWSNRRYKPEDLWAYLPLKNKLVPTGKQPVDWFIDQKLKSKNIAKTAEADKATLIRRVTFGLTGLPPTIKEISEFVNDKSADAWEKLVDRLLASPHYGEKWGQHWLDVSRYSDTSGFSSDWEKSNAWRYRDYVVRSYNNDKPVNKFFLEQIAGDELNPNDPEMTVATGFLRMGPYGTAMVTKPEARQQFLDDITNSVGEAFMATPLKCASCHDHKFDPIPTRDYYSIQAVFATTHPGEMPAKFLPQENQNRFKDGRKTIQMRLKAAQADVDRITKKEEIAARKWMADKGLEYKSRKELTDAPEDKKPPRYIGLTIALQGYRKVRQQDVWMYTRMLERYMPMAQTVYSGGFHVANEKKLRPPKNSKNKNGNAKPAAPDTFILKGGSIEAKGEKVTPGILSAVAVTGNYKIQNGMDGRRLDFAKWLTSNENSLVIRTYVNRIWQGHFGRGIAGNPNNLGKNGAKPTHPQLLDWLSIYFRDNGWSTKKLHKKILMSKAYRLKSSHPEKEKIDRIDPGNSLLSYFNVRRMSSEELRDSILQTTGELRRELGGLPIFPEINTEVALQPRMLQFSLAPAYQPSRTPVERHRRTIYAYHFRGMPDPMQSVFNKPNADDSCERRTSSSVTPQVFTLFNSDNSYDRSIAFALRLERESKSLEEQVRQAYELALGRLPDKEEMTSSLAHVKSKISYHQNNPPVEKKYPTVIDRSLVEEMSGTSFNYRERLDIYENFISDKKMWDVAPQTRALADLCLVLMNSNEFIYIY